MVQFSNHAASHSNGCFVPFLYSQKLKTITEDVIAQPDSLATQARVEKNLLYEKYLDTLRVYEIK